MIQGNRAVAGNPCQVGGMPIFGQFCQPRTSRLQHKTCTPPTVPSGGFGENWPYNRLNQTGPEVDMERLLGRIEVAELLGVKPCTLDAWRKAGLVPQPLAFTQRCIRWRESVVRDWIESKEAQPVG